MSYAAINGLSLYYEEHGPSGGRPLVLLHGGFHTIDLSFGRLLPTLSDGRHVIAVELQGHGHTADTDRPMSLDSLADDVVALLDHLGIERVDLFGFSLGGVVGLRVAMCHPTRVDRLVVAAAHYRPGDRRELTESQRAAEAAKMPTAADFQEMRESYTRVAPDPSHIEQIQTKLVTMMSTFEGWTADDLRGITASTLIVLADMDMVSIDQAIEMHELIPNAQLAVIPGTTHTRLMLRTDILVPILANFL